MKTYRYLHAGRIAESSTVPEGATLLPPVLPSKIVCIGRNYAEHAKELGNEAPSEPVLFFKPISALLAPGGTIMRPAQSQRVDFEGELAIIVGREAKDVKASNWRDYVRGFACANDVTARDLQKKDVQFTRGKGFDTFAPIGPCIETDLDPSDLRISTRVNGETRQDGRTSQMIFALDFLFEYITAIMTLVSGDVILTGTPSGVGPLQAGDVVEVEIEGIGVLSNAVA
ncbi:MAG TPA: fumarylacetoacetate hydrolase family protein [Thermoanaerobaculia bacterium]|jgi:2-keto-4-pentenoate hydratase/2-oxohepta-3-ene-1,7-dioic acid hydratase in catechol pathway|nr:fumarylacetoacetate hydrolase family protein [Thermoanaerobaculia bacterium]